VLGIAAGLTILGAIGAGLAGNSGSTKPPSAASASTAKGSPLTAQPAGPLLAPIVGAGLPPADLLASLHLPARTSVTNGSAVDRGVGLYDESLGLSVGASEEKVIDFFRVELPAGLWQVVSRGPGPGNSGYRIVGQHPASNGYVWEVGITVSPEVFDGPSGRTPFTLRLFEISYDA
jgi:hypothetical protein